MSSKLRFCFFFILLFTTACTTTKMYRTSPMKCEMDKCECQMNKCKGDEYIIEIVKNKIYNYIVEYDDQGLVHDRNQLIDVIQHIKDYEKAQTIIVFVHGWHHNAQATDTNLQDFQDFLKQVSKSYPDRRISGVYVGWRGEAISIPCSKDIKLFEKINSGISIITSFWDRKNVSSAIGHGAIVELFIELEQIAKKNNSLLFTVGHSFGASIVFSAVNNILQERFILNRRDPDDPICDSDDRTYYEGVGNLVILVNPAFEARLYAPLRDMTNTISEVDRPRLVVLASESDIAAKYAFPFGRFFSTLFQSNYNNYGMDISALGHYEPFNTHELTCIEKDCQKNVLKQQVQSRNKCKENSDWLNDALRQQRGEGRWSHEFKCSGLKLTHKGNSNAINPYYVIDVQKNIIPDHTQIFKGQLIPFINALIDYHHDPPQAYNKEKYKREK